MSLRDWNAFADGPPISSGRAALQSRVRTVRTVRARPYPLGRGLPPAHFFMMAPASKRADFETFPGNPHPRRFNDLRRDLTNDGLPPMNLRPGDQGWPQRLNV